ncbi:PspC domain-containing protein [Proteiniborus sp. MB09-C3]|uniref:PspC domain-containing protein n=1 Tax=Proteiniborus sp. MB09-C3 TaxID=3050072 RepID=UPI00255794C9|nr:PspC domain-containing protein [Proteiniborus sp. MB09-C3]WIV10441.1 PspC domain-containing protein [Proteiniborus sp. MB09-C3]
MSKQLYRSRENKVIGGVCGGLAEYLDVDPVIVRLVCVLLFFAKAIGVIAYIVCMIIIPEAPFGYRKNEENLNDGPDPEYTYDNANTENKDERNKMILGVTLIGLGALIFAKKLFYWFDFVNFGGIILVLAGVYIIVNGREKNSEKK